MLSDNASDAHRSRTIHILEGSFYMPLSLSVLSRQREELLLTPSSPFIHRVDEWSTRSVKCFCLCHSSVIFLLLPCHSGCLFGNSSSRVVDATLLRQPFKEKRVLLQVMCIMSSPFFGKGCILCGSSEVGQCCQLRFTCRDTI